MNFNLTLIGQTIAMIVFVWFCMRFIWPPLMKAIEDRRREIADGIAAMIDGLWLRYALTGKPSHVEEPRALTRAYLWAVIGGEGPLPSRIRLPVPAGHASLAARSGGRE